MNRNAYITQYWMIEKKDKRTGVLQWRSVIWQPKIRTPVPPAQAVNVGKRGKKYAEAYKISEDELVWITDKGLKIEEEVNKEGKKEWTIVDYELDGTKVKVDTFKPFSVVQRETIVNQFKKAEEISKRQWTSDKIVAVAQFGAIIFLITLLLVF